MNPRNESKLNSMADHDQFALTNAETQNLQERPKDLVAKKALSEFFNPAITLKEDFEMLESYLEILEGLTQKNSFLMREVKYLIKG